MAGRVPCSCSAAARAAAASGAGFSGRSLPAHSATLPRRSRRSGSLVSAALHAPEHLQDLLPPLIDHLSMAYERVTLPCHSMGCGDYVHRR